MHGLARYLLVLVPIVALATVVSHAVTEQSWGGSIETGASMYVVLALLAVLPRLLAKRDHSPGE